MQNDNNNLLPLLPGWNLGNLVRHITDGDNLYQTTEEFLLQERFCARVSQNNNSMTSLYGHDQTLYNTQSQDICLTLMNILININSDLSQLPTQFLPCRQVLNNTLPNDFQHIDIPSIDGCVLVTVTDLPLELFFAYIGYFRHLLAAASPQREEKWDDYGATRYGDFDEETLPTSLKPERYHDSVTRGRTGTTVQDCILNAKAKRKSGLKVKLDGGKISQNKYLELIGSIDQDNTIPHKIDIIKVFNGDSICFGKIEGFAMMLNGKISRDQYIAIYSHMDGLFAELCGPELLPAREYLCHVFRIQYWFIHIMPFYRGSLAAMNMFRYVMTAYYNARGLNHGRPPLPVVPARFNYFPDLEALFCYRNEYDFAEGSLRLIYCVDYDNLSTD